MPGKSLGRSLDMISDIFLTPTGEATEQKAPEPLALAPTQSCLACKNYISICSDPTCKIFTFDYERFHEPYLAKIDPSFAMTCRYYLPATRDSGKAERHGYDGLDARVQETTTITRDMAVPDHGQTQNHIRRILFQHIEQGFDITRIVMKKKIESMKKNKTEIHATEVNVFIADPL